jgi:hypothetical protein
MPDFSQRDASDDLEQIYDHAVARLDSIRDAWFREGQPLIGTGSTGQEVEHPLARLLRDSEAHVARLGNLCRRKQIGRPPVAVVDFREKPRASRARQGQLRKA